MSDVKAKWEQMQIKTFSKWCSMHLSKRGECVKDITTELRDGIKLIQLLEIIGEANLGKYNKNPKMRLQQIENVNKALAFIKDRGVSLVSIGSEDIVDGNVKLTLGMIWTIILRFAINELSAEGLSAKQGLLVWCQKKTKDYKNVHIKDFQESFKDGLAFCALIHRHRPDLLDYDSLRKENARENLDLAFDVAEKELGIPKLLDTDDIVSLPRPDERSVMTYVAAMYKVFSAYDKFEIAGQRIGKFINLSKDVQDMIHDYEQRAKVMKEWLDASDARFSRDPDCAEDDYQGIIATMAAYKEYRKKERSGKIAEQNDLAALLSNIQVKLRSLLRPLYEPPAGLNTPDIDAGVEQLTAHERTYRAALSSRLRALRDRLRHEFADAANPFAAKLLSIQEFIGQNLDGDFAEQKSIYEAKRQELANEAPALEKIQAAEKACDDCMIEENEYSDHTYDDLNSTFQQLLRTMDKKIAFLTSQINEASGDESAGKRAEFEQSFAAFDQDHDGVLNRLDFLSCLASLGLAQVDFSGKDTEAERLFKKVSEGTGSVNKEQYVRFMQEMTEDTFDPEQIAAALKSIAEGRKWISEADMQRAGIEPELIEYIKSSLPMHPNGQGYDYSSWCQ